MRQTLIVSTGSYLPQKIITNDDLAEVLDTSDEWIRQRSGIRQRHIVAEGETTADLAVAAASQALIRGGIKADAIDAIILATTTPDKTFPATATQVQARLGAHRAFAFDVQAVCAGFVYALDLGDSLIQSGKANRILIIGAESFSRILDWGDRSTAVLFGDGAGAVVLEASEGFEGWGILASALYSDGRLGDILLVDGGVSTTGTVGCVRMKGKEVFRHAVEKLTQSLEGVLAAAGVTPHDLDWLIPHQANLRIMDMLGKNLGLEPAQIISTVAKHANTSAASIPLALDAGVSDGRIKPGHLIACNAIGGGLSWGACVARFGQPRPEGAP